MTSTAMCGDDTCVLRHDCFRHEATPSKGNQTYMQVPNPGKDCDHFMQLWPKITVKPKITKTEYLRQTRGGEWKYVNKTQSWVCDDGRKVHRTYSIHDPEGAGLPTTYWMYDKAGAALEMVSFA